MTETRNRYNAYRCPRGHVHFTFDLDEGTTPFMMTCLEPNCNQMSQSMMYSVDQFFASMNCKHRWYKPNQEQIDMTIEEAVARAKVGRTFKENELDDLIEGITRSVLDHVEKGGLLLQPIPDHVDSKE